MDGPRLDVARAVMDALVTHPEVRRTYVRGSLAAGTADVHSDIDVGVDVSGSDNGRFLLEVPGLLSERLAEHSAGRFAVAWTDFVPALAPRMYVVSVFLRRMPLFWSVDVECVAEPHMMSVLELPVDPVDHLIKRWIFTAKYVLRGSEHSEADVARLAGRVIGAEAAEHGTIAARMRSTLEALGPRATSERGDVLAECAAIMRCIEAASLKRQV